MSYPWSANDILTAADLNAAIATGIISTGLGAWTAYTPTFTQSGAVAKTSDSAYIKLGRLVVTRFLLTASGAGTANNPIEVGLPVTASVGGWGAGAFWMNDVSAGFFSGTLRIIGTSVVRGYSGGGPFTAAMGQTGGGFTAALASTDVFSGIIAYESAA